MRDRVARADYAEQIANRLRLDSRVVRDELKKTAANRRDSLDKSALRAGEEVTTGERQLLELMLASPDLRQTLISALTEEDYADLPTAAIFSALIRLELEGRQADFETLSELIASERERELLADLIISDLAWAGGDEPELFLKRATEALSSLRRRRFERKLELIQIEITKAEREQDGARVLSLYQEKTEIQKRRIALSHA
jgi:hypothetical protein